ncbi:unnamed protein product [Triticum turgidum subsp. durum]|uniref:Peroxidase n=2 Tax=Triticum turgidum subsp. durum TaxID=4567 RepID=A0A9R0SYB1_TRITD|nr:unnamed protein product [Triticum turgidum subsp. durum]
MAARAIVALSLILALVAIASGGASAQLSSGFYSRSCPGMLKAVRSALHPAIATERRVGASIVRLFFHDCFVQGCDASLLLELDDAPGLRGEKNATPNKNSARGFEVIDAVKAAVEECCPGVVSCADILAIAAEESVVFLGGPSWEVKMGRRDSTTASFNGAENNIPPPTSGLANLTSLFAVQGLSQKDMVALRSPHSRPSTLHKLPGSHLQRHKHRRRLRQESPVRLPSRHRLRRQQPGAARPANPDRLRERLLQEPCPEERPTALGPGALQWRCCRRAGPGYVGSQSAFFKDFVEGMIKMAADRIQWID